MIERTLIIIKPDAIQRHLTGQIISRFEKKGFQIIAAKFMKIPDSLARLHYSAHQGQPFFNPLIKYITSSPVMVMVLQGDGVINMVRKLLGATFGYDAEPGTIRGDFSCSGRYNLVHASDSQQSAKMEIELYFEPNELIDYQLHIDKWLYPEK